MGVGVGVVSLQQSSDVCQVSWVDVWEILTAGQQQLEEVFFETMALVNVISYSLYINIYFSSLL